MIRKIVCFTDSEGGVHRTPLDASKADFRRALAKLAGFGPTDALDEATISLETLVEAMTDLDKMIADAFKEDTRCDLLT
jgi:hypothetical protein